MKTVAVVQARMSSSRLPGKVLKDLCGKPMLWHIIKRLRCCKRIDDIVVATSVNPADIAIVNFCKQNGINFFRGSENDVLKRYIDAATLERAYYVVRITADSPLIDPSEIDRLIQTIKEKKAEFVLDHPGVLSLHEGFCVVSLSALRKVYNNPLVENYHKEHVTVYLKENPNFVKTVYFRPNKIFQKKGYRFSVDNSADFAFMEKIYKKFWDGKTIVDFEKVVKFLERNLEYKKINSHVVQKRPNEVSSKVLFLIEGGGSIGFGHLSRTSRIAKYIVEHKNASVVFAIASDVLKTRLCSLGFRFHCVDINNKNSIKKIFENEKPNTLVIDLRSNTKTQHIIDVFRESSDKKIVLIDNVGEGFLSADVNVYPVAKILVPKTYVANSKIYCGLEYFPVGEELIKIKNKVSREPRSIVITMGGSDPNNLTPFIMKSLKSLNKKIKVIVGPGFTNIKEIRALARSYDNVCNFEVYQTPSDYASVVASSSLAITALGISLYEFNFLEIPCIVVGNYKTDVDVGLKLEKAGYCSFAGYYKDVTQEKILSLASRRFRFKKLKDSCDSKAVERLAEIIL